MFPKNIDKAFLPVGKYQENFALWTHRDSSVGKELTKESRVTFYHSLEFNKKPQKVNQDGEKKKESRTRWLQ